MHVHTLDVEGVPILVSIKTLKRLGAVIDFSRGVCIFQTFSEQAFYLKEASSGHDMIDLTRGLLDGTDVSQQDLEGITNLREQLQSAMGGRPATESEARGFSE